MPEDEIKEKGNEVRRIIYTQLRALGVQFCDEAFNVFKPGGPDEARVVSNITSKIVEKLTADVDCQTTGGE